MCDPVSAAALALSAGGEFLSSREEAQNQQRMADAKTNAYRTSMTKQHQFQDEAGTAFNHNVDQQGAAQFDQNATKTANDVKQAFANIDVPRDYNTMSDLSSTPQNVVIAQKAADDKYGARSTRDLNGQAALSGYGGAMFNQDLARSNFARLFGNTQDAASGQTRLLPIEISAAANNANKAPSIFPTLLKGAGMALGLYGAANGIGTFGDTTEAVDNPALRMTQLQTKPGLFSKIGSAFGGFY